ncbi:MAG: chemotaxis protein CheB [Bdellovibrio sp.]
MKTYYLFPGKIAAFKEETIISTLLGSCVAVAIYDPTTKIGGLNHYLLPESASEERPNMRYGVHAIPMLIEECLRLGAKKSTMIAKIYGGGNVINVSQNQDSIGNKNIEIAERILKSHGISVLHRNVAGDSARTIKMNTATFEILHVKTAEKGNNEDQQVDVSGYKPLPIIKNVKVLVVDDSATVRTLFSTIFSNNGLEVVGAAVDPYQARDLIVQQKPDVITLDIEMPKMSGVVFLEKIMKHHPIPIVMVSSLDSTGEQALKSLNLGAVEFVHKPSQFDKNSLTVLATTLVEKVRAAASVNVLTKNKNDNYPSFDSQHKVSLTPGQAPSSEFSIFVMGGNAGSAEALEEIIKGCASDCPPIVVSCGTIAGFLAAFNSKLKSLSKIIPVIAKNEMICQRGHVYFIPANHHGKIKVNPSGPQLEIYKDVPVCSQIPSSNVLFNSAAESYGKNVCAVLLAGYGADGVEGLTLVQKKGGYTMVQDPEETAFPHAPQKSVELGVADEILRVQEIPERLKSIRQQLKVG